MVALKLDKRVLAAMSPSEASQDGYELVPTPETDPDAAAADDPLDLSAGPPEVRQRRTVERSLMRSVIVLALVVSVVMGGSALWAMWKPASWSENGLEGVGLRRSALCADAYSSPGCESPDRSRGVARRF